MRSSMVNLFQDPIQIEYYPVMIIKQTMFQNLLRADSIFCDIIFAEAVKNINNTFKTLLDMSYKETFEKWLEGRPKIVQEMAVKFPPGKYIMKEDAPYAITNPGTEVELYSWLETGEVGIIVKAEDKSEEALEHERMLCARYHKTAEEMETIHKSSIRAHVDPQWLELVRNELDVE